jgi:hypothetical protein
MKPIIMSTDMVKAILDGRKTQTRRVIKPQPEGKYGTIFKNGEVEFRVDVGEIPKVLNHYKCPYGSIGDKLWVRETFYCYGHWIKNGISKTGRQKWRFVDNKMHPVKYFLPSSCLVNIQG